MENIKNEDYRLTSLFRMFWYELFRHKCRALCFKAIRRHHSKARLVKVEQRKRKENERSGAELAV